MVAAKPPVAEPAVNPAQEPAKAEVTAAKPAESGKLTPGTEAFNGNEEEYGSSRLENHFAKAGACAESILLEVRNFSAPQPLRDDASVIVIQAEG